MEEIFHLDDYVDEIIISAEEGVIKPDPKIYRIALERLEAEPETSLLLDDTEENVLAARDIGMKAIKFVNNDQSIPMMHKILNTEG
jgi:HAD superfamily hydrolase (TIGR01509 family)